MDYYAPAGILTDKKRANANNDVSSRCFKLNLDLIKLLCSQLQ